MADWALLLISQDFANSSFIREKELPWIHARFQRGELRVLPLYIGSVIWQTLGEDADWITSLQMLPDARTPLINIVADPAKWQEARLSILRGVANMLSPPGPAEGRRDTHDTTALAEYAYRYDAWGRLTSVTSPVGSTTYRYDNTGQLTAPDGDSRDDEESTYEKHGDWPTSSPAPGDRRSMPVGTPRSSPSRVSGAGAAAAPRRPARNGGAPHVFISAKSSDYPFAITTVRLSKSSTRVWHR